jgi:hypothetical protein
MKSFFDISVEISSKYLAILDNGASLKSPWKTDCPVRILINVDSHSPPTAIAARHYGGLTHSAAG